MYAMHKAKRNIVMPTWRRWRVAQNDDGEFGWGKVESFSISPPHPNPRRRILAHVPTRVAPIRLHPARQLTEIEPFV